MLKKYKQYIKSNEAKFIYTNKIKGKKNYWFEKFGFKFFYRYFKFRYMLTKKPSLFHIEYKLTSVCTLKCKDCCHYTPYFKKHLKPVSFEQFKRDIDKLLKSVDKIYVLSLIGGELLLNKDLYKMVEYARKKKQILFLDITTNATILPDDNLVKTLANRKDEFVWISDYSVNPTLLPKLKLKEIQEIFIRNNIKYIISDFSDEVTPTWLKPPVILSNEDAKSNITDSNKCRIKNCHTYANGIFYLCPLSFYMDYSETGYLLVKEEAVDVLNGKSSHAITQEMINFLTKDTYSTCNYCRLPDDNDFVLPAIQVGEQ